MLSKETPLHMLSPYELREKIDYCNKKIAPEEAFLKKYFELMDIQIKYEQAKETPVDAARLMSESSKVLYELFPLLKERGVSLKKLHKNRKPINDEYSYLDLTESVNPVVLKIEESIDDYKTALLILELFCSDLDAEVDPILEEHAKYLEQAISSNSEEIRQMEGQKEAVMTGIYKKIELRKKEVRETILKDYLENYEKTSDDCIQKNAKHISSVEGKQNLFSSMRTLINGGFDDEPLKVMFLWNNLEENSKKEFEFFKKGAKITYNGLNESMNVLRKEGEKNEYDLTVFKSVYAAAKKDLELSKIFEAAKKRLSEKEVEVKEYLNNGFTEYDSSINSMFRAKKRYENILEQKKNQLSEARSEYHAIIEYLKAHELLEGV